MKTTCNCPKTKLATFLFKAIRLSQASLELSSSRGVFGSLESERERREKREKQTLTEAAGDIYIKMKKCQKIASSVLRVTKWGGGGGAYIGHPMCETTRKPNILANTRDKEVIHGRLALITQK